jgi:N6-adenosine-specific RNA methylase IME4
MTTSTHFAAARKYSAILADPPWSFRNWVQKGQGRNAISHYDCFDFTSLTALPVGDLAADHCATVSLGDRSAAARAVDLINAWGF